MPKPGYNFHLVHTDRRNEAYLQTRYIYHFKTRFNQTYLVEVEEYRYATYAIKFYLKNHADSRNKYNLLTNDSDAFRILSTCVNIISSILNEQKFASFGFIGVPTVGEKKAKKEANTKRFRVYRTITQNYFSPDYFRHVVNIEKSTYIILNKQNKEPNLLRKVEAMFQECYEGL